MTKRDALVYWITEREAMRLRKDVKGLPPGLKYGWSDDPHMGTVRYCNVHRENDKVTKWMRENWSTKDSPMWWFVLGRMLNYIPTLEDIVEFGVSGPDGRRDEEDLPSFDGLGDGLKAMRDSGKKIFTSAYTISTCGQRMDKIDYVISVCQSVKMFESKWVPKFEGLPNIWSGRSLAEAHFMLTHVNGLGSFLAAQVIADLKNTEGHPLRTAPDWYDWCAPGPGSIKGLSEYFYGSDVGVTPSTFRDHLDRCWAEVQPVLPVPLDGMHMQDFQNCLCEFSKYERVKRGGHVRNKYRPG